MKWVDRLILPLTMAFVIAVLSTAAHIAVVQADAKAAADGIALPILMYHHILKESSRQNKYTISPDEFRSDLVYLKENGYTTIVMQDLIDYVKNKTPLPEKPVMITFDDGYESFHEYAFPILQEMNCKAVFSVVGRYADEYTKTDDHHIRYSHATWDQLEQMQKSGLVEIQNHTYNLHSNDQGRDGAKRRRGENLASYREMLSSDLLKLQGECEEHLGWTPTTFTYPFGYISSDALPILMDCGFEAALTCEEKVNYITGDPQQLYHLRRFNRPHGKSAQAIFEGA